MSLEVLLGGKGRMKAYLCRPEELWSFVSRRMEDRFLMEKKELWD